MQHGRALCSDGVKAATAAKFAIPLDLRIIAARLDEGADSCVILHTLAAVHLHLLPISRSSELGRAHPWWVSTDQHQEIRSCLRCRVERSIARAESVRGEMQACTAAVRRACTGWWQM